MSTAKYRRIFRYLLLFAVGWLMFSAAHNARAEGWNNPGANRYTGDIETAVNAWDMPQECKAELIRKMGTYQGWDDLVTITKTEIVSDTGKFSYGSELTDMHGGSRGKIMKHADRSKWKDTDRERGRVYTACNGSQVSIIPSVCGNLARATILPRKDAPPGTVAVWVPEVTEQPLGYVTPLPAADAYNPGVVSVAPGQDYAYAGGGYGYYPVYVGYPIYAGGGGGGSPGSPGHPEPCPCPEYPPIAPPVTPVAPPIPEPSTWAMLGAGLLLVIHLRKRKS